MFSAEELSAPVSSEEPSGENLEYNPLYMELEALASSVPDSQMGDATIEGHDPDWRKLQKNCLELWEKTRDLRVASYLTVAATGLDGLAGLEQGIMLIRFLVSQQWETFWPRLDPEDDNDPLERLNVLAMLSPAPGSFNDPVMFITRLRSIKILPSFRYSLRDLMIANNELEAADEPVDLRLIDAETMAVSDAIVREQAERTGRILECIDETCRLMDEKMGGAYTLSMDALIAELKRLARFYDKHLSSAVEQNAERPDIIEEEKASDPNVVRAVNPSVTAFDLASFKVSGRAEALLLLKKSAEYFQREEPTSPVPFLINRAIRSAEMNFMDLLADIAPDALQRGRDILGVPPSEDCN